MWSTPLETHDGRILPTHGPEYCDWIESSLVYGEGDWYQEPVRLREFQRRWFYRLYEYYPETGRRRYKRALYGMGKGNGKTPIGGWTGSLELCRPDRRSPRVIIGAASRKQAGLVFGDLASAVSYPSPLADFVDIFDLEVRLKGRAGLAERIAADAGTNDGARATVFIGDELHEWEGRGRERVYTIADGAVQKREDGFTLGLSTAGTERDGLLKTLHEYGKRVASGEIIDDSFLMEWFAAPVGLDLSDPDQWMAAVLAANPAAGDFNSIDNIRHRYETMPEYEWRRYHLNQFTATEDQWLPEGAWEARAKLETVEPGTEIQLAFDGSYNNDSTALVGGRLEDKHLFVIDVWEKPKDAHEDWVVPRDEVNARVKETFERFKVREMACDPPGWHEEIARWAETYGRTTVIHYPTNERIRMSEACSKFYTAVMQEDLSHDGDARLARHIQNAVLKETADGAYITKDGRNSPRKIDLAVGAVMNFDRMAFHTRKRKPTRIHGA